MKNAPANLYAPPGYIAASPEVRAAACNGCGTAFWDGKNPEEHLIPHHEAIVG